MIAEMIALHPRETAAERMFGNFTFVRTPRIIARADLQDEAAQLVCGPDYVCFMQPRPASEAHQTMLASEAVLRKEWSSPEEDAAWSDL